MSLPLGWRYRERNIRETGEAFVVPLYVMVPCVLCAFFISPPRGGGGTIFHSPSNKALKKVREISFSLPLYPLPLPFPPSFWAVYFLSSPSSNAEL